ncbi:hypothetical protein [Pontibacter rugosus]|uniref:Uncharacterized protein n=1 Tax=Pontibacter rugosus TaxID=1745966 RepID=A0ABW3SLA5_9BACT
MIEEEKLNSTDKSRIKLEMKQVIISFLAVGIIIAIIIGASIIYIQMSDRQLIVKSTAVSILLLVVVSGFAAFLYHALKAYLQDLKNDSKRTYSGQITDKPTNTNWGWHGNPAADSSSQPKLIEHFIVVDNQRIQVEEEVYGRFEVGDWVSMYFTTQSSILLEIKQESRSGNKV